MAEIHVGHILYGRLPSKSHSVEAVVNTLPHCGMAKLHIGAIVMYLRHDVSRRKDHVGISKSNSFKRSVIQYQYWGFYSGNGIPLPPGKWLPGGRRRIGALLRILQTRVAIGRKICHLATSSHLPTIVEFTLFGNG